MPLPRWLRPVWYCLTLGAFSGAVFWAQRMVSEYSADEQRALVPLTTVWGMHACLIVGIAGFAGLAAGLGRWLGRRHLLFGLTLAVVGYFACGLAPRTNRIFYDEHIYMQIGQTLAHTGRAEYANYARVEYGDFQMYEAWVNKQPNGHPYLLSWVYRIFGVSEEVSHQTVRVVVGLTTALLYFAMVLLPLNLPTATPVAVAMAFLFTPLVLWWGHTVSVEPTAAATTVVGFFAACLHARWRHPQTGEGSPYSGAVLAATAAFAAYFRPESLMVFPVAALVLMAADRRFLEDRVTWAALALALALVTPNLLHLWSVRTEDWGARDGNRFGMAFLGENFRSNTGYFLRGEWFPLAGTVLALVGIGWLAVRNRLLGLAVGTWFILSWGIFVLFYAGGYHYGASSRYAVVSAAPVALLMGLGAAVLVPWARGIPAAGGMLGMVVLMNWGSTLHYVPTLSRESAEARADIDWIRETAVLLPTGSLVISPDPCVWSILGRNASQFGAVETMVRTQMQELVNQYPGGIYLHWDYWVNAEPRIADSWRQIIVDTRASVFRRGTSEQYKFALFRLDTALALQTMGGGAEPNRRRPDMDEVVAEALAGSTGPARPRADSSAERPDAPLESAP
ncbi:MAG: glycosyltransferase family 39 protein [Opitutaceae bacterium]|nr:glycosyltransferase family 39 protein [Opitutaceae bacterium]